MTGLWLTSYIALWVLFLVVAVVLVSVLRNLGAVYASLRPAEPGTQPPTKLAVGDTLPEVGWRTLTGQRRTLSDFRGAKRAFAVVSPNCGPCAQYLQAVMHDGDQLDPVDATVQELVIISLGDPQETTSLLERAGASNHLPVLLDPDRGVVEKWGISAAPSTVIADEELRVVRQVFGVDGTTIAPRAGTHAT